MEKIKKILWLAILFFALTGCETDDVKINEEYKAINEWSYGMMQYWYLWNDEIPTNINSHLGLHPYDFFNSILYYQDEDVQDKWSMMVDDVDEWEKVLSGSSAETGAVFQLASFSDGHIFGIIQYIEPGSPAENAGLQRGDVILYVNGVAPNIDNYTDFYFGDGPFEYGLGHIEETPTGLTVYDDDRTVSVAEEEFQIEPIHITKTFDANGKKIGYLMYNSFLSDADAVTVEQDAFLSALSQVFADFKAQQIDELILDLRYNLGGSATAAIRLASLIVPATQKGQKMAEQIWNDGINQELDELIANDKSYESNRWMFFEDLEENLDFSKVHVITTNQSASSSELVINALKPFMEVILIGSDTHGKFVGSITIDDETGSHKWALQPICFKAANMDGYTDFWNGFAPDVETDDDFLNELGDQNENMLSVALAEAAGTVSKKRSLKLNKKRVGLEKMANRKPGMFFFNKKNWKK